MLAGSVANLALYESFICMEHVGNGRKDLRSSRLCIDPSGKVSEEVL